MNTIGGRSTNSNDNVNAYRLTGQLKSGERATFTYDNAGNMLTKWQEGSSPLTFVFDNSNRITSQLQGTALTTITYDATGNLTEENTSGTRTTNVYDNAVRLVNVKTGPSTISTYTYNRDGLRRTAFEAGEVLKTMVWDGTDYLGEY